MTPQWGWSVTRPVPSARQETRIDAWTGIGRRPRMQGDTGRLDRRGRWSNATETPLGENNLSCVTNRPLGPDGRAGRLSPARLLASLVAAGLVAFPGCGAPAEHVADPAAAAKTLTDPNTSPPVKASGNKKVQQFAEQYRQDVAKHPKIR